MARPFVNEQAERAFVAAIRTVERQSAAEVVVSVRHHSASYLHADMIVGVVGAVSTLALMLFSPWPFSVSSILVDPLLVGLVFGLASTQVAALRRCLLPASKRRAAVQLLGRALFFEKGIRLTRQRTGILVHISLLERMVEVVADTGVLRAVPNDAWQQATASIEHELRRRYDGTAVAAAIAALGDVLGRYLPAADDDINELADEVSAS